MKIKLNMKQFLVSYFFNFRLDDRSRGMHNFYLDNLIEFINSMMEKYQLVDSNGNIIKKQGEMIKELINTINYLSLTSHSFCAIDEYGCIRGVEVISSPIVFYYFQDFDRETIVRILEDAYSLVPIKYSCLKIKKLNENGQMNG